MDIPNQPPERRIVIDGSRFIVFFQQKVQKISQAIYMVTSYMEEDEPLRLSLRRTALDMIESLHMCDLSGGISVRLEFDPLFKQILAYLSVGKTIGYISEMNADILIQEISSLSEMVSDDSRVGSSGVLSTEFFSVPTIAPPSNETFHTQAHPQSNDKVKNHRNFDKRQSSDNSSRNSPGPVSDSQGQKNNFNINDNSSQEEKSSAQQSQRNQKDNSYTPKHSSSTSSRTKSSDTRRLKILSLFTSGKQKITIHDVEKAIEGFSTKTMQRELMAMVEEGVLIKEGEKRWSEYRLPSN